MNNKAFEIFPAIETQNLYLKEITNEHDKDIFRIFSDDKAMEFYDLDTFASIDEARDLISRMSAGYRAQRYIRWGISKKFGGPIIIGTCGFHNFDRRSSRVELGFELVKDYWRQGIMTESLSAIIPFGFEEMNFHRIETFIDPGNVASKRLLVKLGFQEEGFLRERDFLRGSFKNSLIYSLLRGDYIKIKKNL